MKHPALLAHGLLAAASLVVALVPASAQQPDPPPFYAIADVQVITGTGETLDGVTVLLADGLIEAIGSEIEVPADARVIDGSGLTLYAGLVNALAEVAIEEEDQGAGPPAGGGGFPGSGSSGPEIRGPEDRPRTQPWRVAADQLDASSSQIASWREGGFTSVITAQQGDLFAGQASWINLADAEAKELVVAPSVAQVIGMDTSRGSFPGSLMGVIAYLKQVFEDVDRYRRAIQLYDSDPTGRQRPDYDRTLQPLLDAQASGKPFLLPGVTAPQIGRALALAEEYGLQGVVVGAHEAYRDIDSLAEAGVAVLLNVDWPSEPKDRAPDAEDVFRDLAHRQLAPSSAARLRDGGVQFAFTGGGLRSPSKMLEGVRAAVDAGLPEDQALAALTRTPAEIFGVADRVGTVEVGRIANLVLATGMPWEKETEIHHVFVDGRPYGDPPEADEEPVEAAAVDVSGTWEVTLTTPGGDRELTARLEQDAEGKVTGEVESSRGTTDIEDGRVSGNVLSFGISQETPRGSMTASYRAEVDGEELEGTFSAGPMSMEVVGKRTAAAAPADEEKGEDDAADRVTDAELLKVWETYQGPADSVGETSFAITNATVHPVSSPAIEGATVVVRDGKISAVGQDVGVPRGVATIDGTGLHVTPGIIDAHSHIAGEGGINEGTLNVTAMVGIGDIIDPDDIAIYRALAGGVTSINILHGSANPIGGKNAVIKLRWGQDAEGLRFEGAPAGIKFALGENPKRSRGGGFGPGRYPATRMGVMDVVRQAFVDARAYRDAWAEYERAKAAGEEPMPVGRDLKLEALVEILEGDRLVHAHSYRADEILQLLRLAEEMDFRIATLQHVLEGYKVADEIAAHGAGASTFSDWWGYKVEAYDAIPYNASLMTERGVLVSINSDSAEEMRHLNHEAGKALRWGSLDEQQALALVTLNAAKQLKIDDRVGSIEKGKDADLVVYRGHPLSNQSIVLKTYVDGRLWFDLEVDRQRQQTIADIKARMTGGETEESGDAAPASPAATPVSTPDLTSSLRRRSFSKHWSGRHVAHVQGVCVHE